MYEKEISDTLKNLLKGKGASGTSVDINMEKLLTLSLKQLSVGYDSALYLAGFKSGESFTGSLGIKDMAGLKESMELLFSKSGMGDAKMMKTDPATMKVEKNSTCYGTKSLGKPACFFKAGFLAGAVSTLKKRKVPCVETKCYAKGDDYCEFQIRD